MCGERTKKEKMEEFFNPFKEEERTLELIACYAKGMLNKDAANKMCMSYHTVRDYRKVTVKRAGLRNMTQLVYIAGEQGWVGDKV